MEVMNLVHELTRQPCADPVERVIHTGRLVQLPVHTVLVDRRGGEHILAASAAPIIDQGRQVIGAVLVFQDITQKRQTEAELLKMEKLFLPWASWPAASPTISITSSPVSWGNLSLAILATGREGSGGPAPGGSRGGHAPGPGPGAAAPHLCQGRRAH
jgi:hypothetical protein